MRFGRRESGCVAVAVVLGLTGCSAADDPAPAPEVPLPAPAGTPPPGPAPELVAWVDRHPRRPDPMGEDVLSRHLDDADRIFAAAGSSRGAAAGHVSSGFDELRWFELPSVCLP
jgi:hypothetical protein